MNIYEHNIRQIKINDTNVRFAVKDSMIWVPLRTTKIFILGRNLTNASIVQLVLQAGGIIDSMKKLILEKAVNIISDSLIPFLLNLCMKLTNRDALIVMRCCKIPMGLKDTSKQFMKNYHVFIVVN